MMNLAHMIGHNRTLSWQRTNSKNVLFTETLIFKCVSIFWHVYVLWLGVYWWKRDVRATHDMTSERYTMWRQSVTQRDVRYVPRCDVRALHDVTSDMSHERQDFVTWLLHANAHPASRISQYDNSHPVPCFWILLQFRNTIVRVRSRVIRDMIIEL